MSLTDFVGGLGLLEFAVAWTELSRTRLETDLHEWTLTPFRIIGGWLNKRAARKLLTADEKIYLLDTMQKWASLRLNYSSAQIGTSWASWHAANVSPQLVVTLDDGVRRFDCPPNWERTLREIGFIK